MTRATTANLTRGRTTAALWYGIVAGPIAALVMQLLDYIIVPFACGPDDNTAEIVWLHVVALLLIVATVAAAIIAWRYRRYGEGHDAPDAGETNGRIRFMAHMGVGVSALMLLVLIAEWIPIFIVHPCQYV